MESRIARLTVLVVCLTSAAACAHGAAGSGDPVEDVRLTLVDLMSPDGACPAEQVLVDRSFLAPPSPRPTGGPLIGAQSRPVVRTIGRAPLNLSQASNAMAMRWEFEQSVAANVRAGLPVPDGAGPGVADVGIPGPTGTAAPERGEPRKEADALGGWTRSNFAAGWALYFDEAAPQDTRNAALDALTSWSLRDPGLLEAYHGRFVRALRRDCGGE